MATNPIDAILEEDGIVEDAPAPPPDEPLYRVVGDAKIPVSRKMGMIWQSRRDHALQMRGTTESCWDEAIRYYENDQMNHRKSRVNSSGNTVFAHRINNEFTETENIVFSNAALMVPMLYMRNPQLEFSYNSDAQAPLAEVCEVLANKLFKMRTPPGVNIKPKIRKAILAAILTNAGYIKLNWVARQDSSEQAVAELERLATELQNAKSEREIRDVEGKIAALEERVDLLSPAGPQMSFKLAHQILVDPQAMEADHSDATWIMEWDYLPTSYINAVYTRDGRSIYEPTHVLSNKENGSGGHDIEDEVNNFSLFLAAKSNEPSAYGYTTADQLRSAQYTKVWWVWDKTTRRVFLFCDNYWKWPLWVWDDPLRLPRFFPYFRLWFHDSLVAAVGKGEVTYYLDQQDAINEINDEARRARYWARRNLFYNSNVLSQEDAEAVLKGPDGTARGINVPEGSTIQDAVFSIVPPSLKFPDLFQIQPKLDAVNRITGINDAQRGAQFKTNTTNEAIAEYRQAIEVRRDDKTDAIEDFVADLGWNMVMLCLMNWDAEDVISIVGPELAANWQRINDPRMFSGMFTPQVEAGSTEKPNSTGKKQLTLEMAQILGQFASASPAVVLPMLKMFQRAFPDFIITKAEWELIIMTIQMALTKAGSGPASPAESPSQEAQGEAE